MSKHKTRQITRITNATLALISDEGLSRLSISRVADAVGVTRQTVYNYFPDVDAIITGALESHGKAMEQHLLDIIASSGGPYQKLTAFAQFQISIASSEHENLSLEAGLPIEARKGLDRHTSSVKNVLRKVIEEGKNTGDFAKNLDPGAATDLVWGMVLGAVDAAIKQPDKKPYFAKAIKKAMWAALSDPSLSNHDEATAPRNKSGKILE